MVIAIYIFKTIKYYQIYQNDQLIIIILKAYSFAEN